MNTTVVLVSAAFLALFVLLRLVRSRALAARWLQEPGTHLRSVDLEAFRNLIDPTEEQFLRTHLPPAEFRSIQRQRLRAAIQYVSAVAHNAKVLLRLGHAARLNSDPSIAASGESLVETALQLRFTAFRSLAVLYLRIVLPGGHVSLSGVAEGYDLITGQVVMLGLRYPARSGPL